MKLFKGLVLSVVLASSAFTLAQRIVRGPEAQSLYNQFVLLQSENPDGVISYINGYFGSSEEPQLGKVWVTTIFRKGHSENVCYQYDYRDAKTIKYTCVLAE